ncbi:preprotein translocase subunit SecG [Campylobacter sp. RM12640]|uniref:preprotein translocase subunit SecG n=1 Tax=unclassified Campylobacter TaxID=2593542 RepID=UPI001BD9903E|nr:preprotein translocase subunit SecG [Campylobacter sp. 2018MI01]MBT0879918.1 preprotein translocase subunit SecG [Campylobacter sp. 2018MI27]MBT0882183.1 preprotein translocase subunit SecG [Campylobacter sp. 2018MI13]MBT0884311.1 preprotein translocase subunit SecG [Campylobacter sp. 2018MI10]MBZ7975545.1 preprotein translocase subunit SecG [Campylobacter sp. RM12637]MBZ7978579.1 preprotein translocase subunit SecG [Campylobacter sp. RM12654]MBZ7981054.1 preprotein translocase subunit Sec
MNTIFIAIQFILVVIICACVLMQKSSSIGLGAYSGSNESLFGAKGPAGFLAKFTFIIGVLLVANTIYLSYSYNTKTGESLVNKLENASKQLNDTNQPKALPESIK